jgi:hypothetical protein
VLARQAPDGDPGQPPERGALGPGGKGTLAQRPAGAGDRGEHQGLPRGESIALGQAPPPIARDLGVDERREVQRLGPRPEGRDRPVGHRAEVGPRRPGLEPGEQGVGAPEVGEDKRAGLPVHPAGFDDLPVLPAPDGLGHE